MKNRKRWQFFLIAIVILLTVYNILPTVFYYSKSLNEPVREKGGNQTALAISSRVNQLEAGTINWLGSFCRLLKIKPTSITLNPKDPGQVIAEFKSNEDASKFRKYLPRAGEIIAFVPAQLSLQEGTNELGNKKVIIQRRIPIHFDPSQTKSYFKFSAKWNSDGNITPLYQTVIQDRVIELAAALGGSSENGELTFAAPGNVNDPETQDLITRVAQNIVTFEKAFGENTPIAKRYFSSFSQVEGQDRASVITNYLDALDTLTKTYSSEKNALSQKEIKKKSEGGFLDTLSKQRLDALTAKLKTLNAASALITKHQAAFSTGAKPLVYTDIETLLKKSDQNINPETGLQTLSLKDGNPFISGLVIDWKNEKIFLTLHEDVSTYLAKLESTKKQTLYDQVNQFLYDEIATTSRKSNEKIVPSQERYEIALSSLQNSKSFLAMPLSSIAAKEVSQVKESILSKWDPKHPDLSKENFPIWDFETYIKLPAAERKLGLVVFSPVQSSKNPPKGFRMNSVYVIAKGVEKILRKVQTAPDSPEAKQFLYDFNQLRNLLQKNGFYGRPATLISYGPQFKGDFIFESQDYFQSVLKAMRENFTVHGTRRFAVLEFSNEEQRLLTLNKIETTIHEDLLKWRDNYNAANLGIRGMQSTDVPKPTRNPLWSNIILSAKKYFRGDERKILHWGLDLSGGKTVQIELRDSHNRPVTKDADIHQGINELYNRVNKMGVSEVGIRQEGNFITLDFPGSQGWSASELVKASLMHFNIVNEKFSSSNANLTEHVNRFLQEVWNEADVTGKKDIEEINAIAYRHLYGDSIDPDTAEPRTEAAKILYDNGLRLSDPLDADANGTFNDVYSKIGRFRGDDVIDWQGQTNPLIIIFRNFALEGADLENIHASYDPNKGNYLSFGVQSSRIGVNGEKLKPRDDLYAWTSQFSKEKIAGTQNEIYSRGHGWRMAVILNGSIISAPTLDSPLRDNAMISGSFSQREVNALEADLKAGSLTFTPKILSEKNVSPELGSKERMNGILSTVLAIILVVICMVIYYRFGGIIASIAVIFNLLIMWATLQNLEATLTLSGIAGIILTMGMAVDANVLVFERIREEFRLTKRLASAVNIGYRKAFTAIFDSNLTTIIAAVILLQFDSGPIRGFAITIIIGIVSSMFTALFMTRYYFMWWVRNPKHKTLTMANWVKGTKINFLKYSKMVGLIAVIIILVGGYMGMAKRHTIFGMDFTGGYALNFELETTQNESYRSAVEEALIHQGLSTQDFQIRELNPTSNIRLFLSHALDQKGRPFFGMPLTTDTKELGYGYENNPRISWIVSALNTEGVKISPASLERLDKNWTDVSGQISESMRNQAILGLSIALLCILVYITMRFEFTYALSATVCLAHDVLISLASVALLHYVGVPIQIDLTTIAAVMTIVGYSLNDTIIVFDRIRENIKLLRKESLRTIIVQSLNTTLSRTVMTSLTTLLVLIPLAILGGGTLFGFALVMIFGVVFGTLSSLFIAAPLMLYFHKKREGKAEEMT